MEKIKQQKKAEVLVSIVENWNKGNYIRLIITQVTGVFNITFVKQMGKIKSLFVEKQHNGNNAL